MIAFATSRSLRELPSVTSDFMRASIWRARSAANFARRSSSSGEYHRSAMPRAKRRIRPQSLGEASEQPMEGVLSAPRLGQIVGLAFWVA